MERLLIQAHTTYLVLPLNFLTLSAPAALHSFSPSLLVSQNIHVLVAMAMSLDFESEYYRSLMFCSIKFVRADASRRTRPMCRRLRTTGNPLTFA